MVINVKCPKCGLSLMDQLHFINGQPSINLDVVLNGLKGTVYFSSIWNDFTKKSTIKIPRGAVSQLYCPHCKRRIISEKKCSECHSYMIRFDITEGGQLYICARSGCKEHKLVNTKYSPSTSKIKKTIKIINE